MGTVGMDRRRVEMRETPTPYTFERIGPDHMTQRPRLDLIPPVPIAEKAPSTTDKIAEFIARLGPPSWVTKKYSPITGNTANLSWYDGDSTYSIMEVEASTRGDFLISFNLGTCWLTMHGSKIPYHDKVL